MEALFVARKEVDPDEVWRASGAGRLRGANLAGGVRGARSHPECGVSDRADARPLQGAPVQQPGRRRPGWPGHPALGHRRAEAALPAPDRPLRGDLVPALLRAGRRLRPRRAGHPGRARRRHLGGQRAEGVDEPRRHRRLTASSWPAPTPTVPKHTGITAFLVPMDCPGVTVRPVRQITGDAEFCEVFLDDAGIDDSMRLGPVNEGWRVAISVLMNERRAVSGSGAVAPGHGHRSLGRRAHPAPRAAHRPDAPPAPGAGLHRGPARHVHQPAGGRPPPGRPAAGARRARSRSCSSASTRSACRTWPSTSRARRPRRGPRTTAG